MIITIDGVIGWDVYASTIKRQLAEADGNPVTVEISSPGGFVYEGLTIFNYLRDYSRNKAKVTIKLIGLAASMASYIAMVGDEIQAEDNAVFMIHNPWGFAVGDHIEMKKIADEMERLGNLLANAYAKRTGKDIEEIKQLMNDETFYFGSEAQEAGFVDKIIGTSTGDDKDGSVAMAQGRIKSCLEKMRDSEKSKSDIEKAAALLPDVVAQNPANDGVKNVINETKKPEKRRKSMTLDELKAEYPELYKEVLNLGKSQVNDNISAHLEFYDVAPEAVIEAITKNEEYSPKHAAKYAKAQMKAAEITDRNIDDNQIGDINQPQDNTDDAVIMAAFEKGLGAGTMEV